MTQSAPTPSPASSQQSLQQAAQMVEDQASDQVVNQAPDQSQASQGQQQNSSNSPTTTQQQPQSKTQVQIQSQSQPQPQPQPQIQTQPRPQTQTQTQPQPQPQTSKQPPVSGQPQLREQPQVERPKPNASQGQQKTQAQSAQTEGGQNDAQTATKNSQVKPSSLLEVLVAQQVLAQDEVDQIVAEQLSTGKDAEVLLLEKKIVSEMELTKAKATFYDIPFINLAETGISPEALNVLPESVARRYKMLPFVFDEEGNRLKVAMANPLDVTAIDFAQQKTGMQVEVYYAVRSQLERNIAERYAQSLSGEVTKALEETDQASDEQIEKERVSSLSQGVVRQAPITKIVKTILSFAIKSRASDVHIEPELQRTRIRYRIDGILREKLILPDTVHDAVVSRIKILSQLKIDEKRVPQDGRFSFESEGVEIDLRVSTLPTTHGEKVVMRLLKKNMKVPSLNELGLRGLALSRVKKAIKDPNGIILITGPTGSGKTTTLYSALNILNSTEVNIMTLEDPVEYQMKGVNQVQVNPQAGLTFANGLRSFLRQDPDIIMVGEIRDNETVGLAIQASLTGHLVFSTLHTNSAVGAIPRLEDMGGESFLLASSMELVMGQRVVRRINPDYKEEYQPEDEVIKDIKQVLGDHFERWCQENGKDPNQITLYRPRKNRPQTEPDYKGRVGIFEVMLVNEKLSEMILKGDSDEEMEDYALQQGMMLMKQDGYLKALAGITTIEEVLRVAEV